MTDRLIQDWFPEGLDPAAYDPVRSARAAMRAALPKRFYSQVGIEPGEGGFRLLLDGRGAKTPARNTLALPTKAAAEAMAEEWAAQDTHIDPALMPITRIVHSGLDHVSGQMEAVQADLLRYAASDLLCYRAGEPQRLVERQNAVWQPVLDWAARRYGARFMLTEGITYVEQPAATLAAMEGAVAAHVAASASPAVALASLHVMTTLMGSVLLTLAVAEGFLAPEAAFDASELDADTQVELWGTDEEASDRRARRRRDLLAAARLFAALK